MLTGLIYYLDVLLDQEGEGRHRAERVQNSEVPYVRYLDRSVMKMYDYINRVLITLPLNGLRGYVDDTLPSRCYASP